MKKQQVKKKKKVTKKAAGKSSSSRKAAGSNAAAKKPATKKAARKKPASSTKVHKKAAARKKTVSQAASKAKRKPGAKKAVKKTAASKAVSRKTASKKAAAKKVAKKKVVTKAAAKQRTANTNSTKRQPVTATTNRKRASKKVNGSSTAPMDGDWLPEGYEPRIDLPEGYTPNPKEEYMCAEHLEYFRRKLYRWRKELVDESLQTIDHLRSEVRDVGDEAERATRETENSLELRTRDRYRKLIRKVDQAIKRIDEGDYGYCEETDEEIGLARLEARPIATLSLDAQERWELKQKQLSK